MQPSPDLSALLRAYVEQQTDAFTVAAWMQLTDTIADAQFLLASPAGAAVYGFLPEELVGQYVSQRHTPEDHYKGLKLATARRLGRVVPQPYPTRILTRNGTLRSVIKRVRMIDLATTTLWITHLLPARKMLPTPDIDLDSPENLRDDQQPFTLSISVAEATRTFAEGLPYDPYERMGGAYNCTYPIRNIRKKQEEKTVSRYRRDFFWSRARRCGCRRDAKAWSSGPSCTGARCATKRRGVMTRIRHSAPGGRAGHRIGGRGDRHETRGQ